MLVADAAVDVLVADFVFVVDDVVYVIVDWCCWCCCFC